MRAHILAMRCARPVDEARPVGMKLSPWDASPLPSLPRTREPPARHQASAATRLPHASTGYRMPAACRTHASRTATACQHADRPPTGGRGFDLRRAADVLIHPPVPKKKAKWRIRGCGAHAVARGHRASDRTLCAPNGVLRGLVKVCQANLRGWGIVSVLSGQSEAQCGGVVPVDACVENMGVFFQHLIGLSGTRCNGV
jgi:hypothetical protein